MADSASCCPGSAQSEYPIAIPPPPFPTRVRTKYTSNSNEETVLLSPIRRVPPEILMEIVLNVLPGGTYEDNPYARHDRMLPSHICKEWRDLSLSTPKLWANISVELDREDCSRKLECATTWLARSGSCPLTITLACRGDYQAQWNQLVALFLPHCRRWREASIVSDIRTGTDLSPIKHKLDMLESLAVSSEWSEDMPFEFAPKLRRLSLSTYGFLTPDGLLSLPWAQLTYVGVLSWSAAQCLDVMQNLSSVTALKVRVLLGPLHNIERLADVPVLRIEHLEDLTVIAEHDITGFHEYLDLPLLARYTYSEGNRDGRWSLPAFLSLISRSSCRLASIDISLAVAMGKDGMAMLLQLLPDLAYLNLHCDPISGINSNNLLTLLTRSATSFLVPQLEHLVLDHDDDFEFQLFFDMMDSRREIDEEIPATITHRKCLRTVEICHLGYDRSLDHGVTRCLDALVTGGLDIQLPCEGTGERVIW
ncbi:hypothetical protein FIBSPDRAFT_41453 [Athelia psychrophila]|uniref:F-box domain-containing protein n=1 Tax=Athelia psychrophila TaxID=1759441 RepID=A0A166FM46_9AGAM|nr:hypothetical protein FIBSPDRAFT_41453 [Fibularhizoctonia sp. CBS 109695]